MTTSTTASTLTQLAPTQVALEFTITDQELAEAEERAFRRLVKSVRLPGFRPGKVPRKIFEQTYGSDTLTSRAVEEVIPEVYSRAVREHDIDPIEQPTLDILEEEDGRPRRLKATVEVRPRITLGAYKGVAVRQAPDPVDEAEVTRSLEALAKDRATLVPVDRPAQFGDVVTIDYAGSVDGEAFEGGTAAGQVTELDEGRFVPGFAAGIAGMRAGENRTIEAQFPAEYPAAQLAGKAAQFEITLHDVKEYELPTIDDEFAKALSGRETVAELRADLRARLEAVAQSRTRRAIGNAIVERLLASHDVPLPPSMIEKELDHFVEDAAAAAARTGTTFEQYLAQVEKSQTELRESFREEAEKRVKAGLLIEAIAKAERIAATPADIAEEIEVLSRRYGQPVATIRKALGNNVLSLMDGIVRTKTLDFLIENAAVEGGDETSTPAS